MHGARFPKELFSASGEYCGPSKNRLPVCRNRSGQGSYTLRAPDPTLAPLVRLLCPVAFPRAQLQDLKHMSLSGGMMVLRAMVLGWMVGLFTSIHERVLYPSHRPGGEGMTSCDDVNPHRHSLSRIVVSQGIVA
jgi:hypothetical protein